MHHIPKAINLPIGEFEQMYDKISPLLTEDKAIIIYCIGIHCIDSSLLAKELYQKGYREIFVYKKGMEEWQELGYPIEGKGGTS
jgi:rhodanese-related sulfurtransferase